MSPSSFSFVRVFLTVLTASPVSVTTRASSVSDSWVPSFSRMSRMRVRALLVFDSGRSLARRSSTDLPEAPSPTARVIGSSSPGTSTASMRNAWAEPLSERLPATTWM